MPDNADHKDSEPSSRARHRRTNCISRFTETQRQKREWINFDEIADWRSKGADTVPPDAHGHERTLEMLKISVLDGDFDENGRSRVLFLQPWNVHARMTAQWLRRLMKEHEPEDIRSAYLAYCWLPRNLFDEWLDRRHYPESPSRFERKHVALAASKSTVAVDKKEQRAIGALATLLRRQPNLARAAAIDFLKRVGFEVTARGFQERIWPKAREAVGLPARAPPGRKPKSSH